MPKFTKEDVGKTVFSITLGECTIESWEDKDKDLNAPVYVRNKNKDTEFYTEDGMCYLGDVHPSLFPSALDAAKYCAEAAGVACKNCNNFSKHYTHTDPDHFCKDFEPRKDGE